MHRFRNKRGQSASAAATLVALIAGLILLYVLFLPPAEREALLGDQPYTPGAATYGGVSEFKFNKTIMQESPGRIDFLKATDYEHPLPSVNLYTTTAGKVLKQENSLYAKNGIFDKLDRNISFSIPDLENTDNILLSFNVATHQGRLLIKLNDRIIYDGEVLQQQALPIPKEDLGEENMLVFSVNPVGWKFWTTNEYELKQIKITADVTDISEQISRNVFTMTDTEKFNLDTSKIQFVPECDFNTAGKLDVYINNEPAYSSIPDCGQLNVIEFSPEILSAGNNQVIFKTQKGAYSIYQIKVKNKLKKQTYPVYYFELDERFFEGAEEEENKECGDIDGYCPSGCSEDADKDCCFEGAGKYWCDVKPNREDDRCAEVIDADYCGVCPSGYEDENGNPPEACEELCGDDTDGKCLGACSKYIDKDCCYEESELNFWCDDFPKFQVTDTCKRSLSVSECDKCPTIYKTKTGKLPCKEEETIEISKLKDKYDANIVFKFIDDGTEKTANIYVNGHRFYLKTSRAEYKRGIDNYVEKGSNAVKIEPDQTTLDIRSVNIEIDTH